MDGRCAPNIFRTKRISAYARNNQCDNRKIPHQIRGKTRRSENDNTPQPLDQRTNSPFMGQQVGNWSICHALWAKRKAIVHPILHFISIHPFIPMIELFKYLTFKIQGQSQSSRSNNRYNILSTHIPFIPCWSALPFLRCSYLKNWPWKSKVKFMGDVKVKSHNVSLTSYRLTSLSFHVNRASHCWVTTFSKLDLDNQGSTS